MSKLKFKNLTWLKKGDRTTGAYPAEVVPPSGNLNVPLYELLQNDEYNNASLQSFLGNYGNHNHDDLYYNVQQMADPIYNPRINKNKLFPKNSLNQRIVLFDVPIYFGFNGVTQQLTPGSDGTGPGEIPIYLEGVPAGSPLILSVWSQGFHGGYLITQFVPNYNSQYFTWNGSSWDPTGAYTSGNPFIHTVSGEVGKYGTQGYTCAGGGIIKGPVIITGSAANVTIWGYLK